MKKKDYRKRNNLSLDAEIARCKVLLVDLIMERYLRFERKSKLGVARLDQNGEKNEQG